MKKSELKIIKNLVKKAGLSKEIGDCAFSSESIMAVSKIKLNKVEALCIQNYMIDNLV